MIVKERVEPGTIAVLEALLRRLPNNEKDYMQFEEKLAREKAGYRGEMRVDREWNDLKIQVPYRLLNGLQFENDFGFSHQIDSIFICSNFALVMEVKNIAGRIDINEETNQCTRTRADGFVEGFTNPVDQVRRHVRFVSGILREFDVFIPVESAVIFANPNSIIGQISTREVLIFHVSGLRYKLEDLFQRHRQARISEDQMDTVINELVTRQVEKNWELKMNLDKIRKGALCKRCNYRSRLMFQYGKWVCARCRQRDDSAFIEALNDYRLLWSEWITNREFRDFFGIDSIYKASRILRSLGVESVGSYKDKMYRIPPDLKI